MANEILTAMSGFGAYLRDENKLRKEELQKEKEKISAQRVAAGFKTLQAYDNESDARKLVYELISDAASLDSLNASLPLIDTLYRDSISGIKNYKAQKQDEALRTYAESEYGMTGAPDELSGAQVFELAKYNKTLEKDVDVNDLEGRKLLQTYDRKNRLINEIIVDPRTDRSKAELELEFSKKKANYQHGLGSSLKSYAGLTENGLPMLLGRDGVYVQEGGKLRLYDENLDGPVNKGSSYNTQGTWKTPGQKLDYWTNANKKAFIETEGYAKGIADMLGLPATIAVDGRGTLSSYTETLKKQYGTDYKKMWSDIYIAIDNRDDLSDSEKKELRKSYYENTFSQYKNKYGELKMTSDEISKTNAETQAGLKMDSFDDYNEMSYNFLKVNIADKVPTDKRNPSGIASLYKAGTLNDNEVTAYLVRYYTYELARSKGKTLSSVDDFQKFYNKLGYSEKAKIFSKLVKK